MHFSVITITKNNQQGFAKTEKSVKAQTCKDYEWIVIDGDKEPDNGIYDAMNKGIDQSNGEYLIFMNAGDEFADANVLEAIRKYDADFIYGDAIEEGRIKRAKNPSKMKGGMITHHQAMVYKRAVIGDLRYDERYKLAADYKFTLEFLSRATTTACINQALCIFETGGVSQVHAAKARAEERQIRKELGVKGNPLTPLRQRLAIMVKTSAPSLYWLIRS